MATRTTEQWADFFEDYHKASSGCMDRAMGLIRDLLAERNGEDDPHQMVMVTEYVYADTYLTDTKLADFLEE